MQQKENNKSHEKTSTRSSASGGFLCRPLVCYSRSSRSLNELSSGSAAPAER
jgi:hypothetical protein